MVKSLKLSCDCSKLSVVMFTVTKSYTVSQVSVSQARQILCFDFISSPCRSIILKQILLWYQTEPV